MPIRFWSPHCLANRRAHRSSRGLGNFDDRPRAISMILVNLSAGQPGSAVVGGPRPAGSHTNRYGAKQGLDSAQTGLIASWAILRCSPPASQGAPMLVPGSRACLCLASWSSSRSDQPPDGCWRPRQQAHPDLLTRTGTQARYRTCQALRAVARRAPHRSQRNPARGLTSIGASLMPEDASRKPGRQGVSLWTANPWRAPAGQFRSNRSGRRRLPARRTSFETSRSLEGTPDRRYAPS